MIAQGYIGKLYAAFSGYKFHPGFRERCSPLTPPTDEQLARLRKPLKEISEEDFDRYPGSAIYTWGDLEDYKYFFPRLTELVALSPKPAVFEEFYFYKFDSLDFNNWPETEKEVTKPAIEQYFIYRISDAEGYGIDHLETIVNLIGPARITQLWEEDPSTASSNYIADFLLNKQDYFSRNMPRQSTIFVSWFNSEGVKNKLQQAVTNSENDLLRFNIQTALDYLNNTGN